MKTTPTEDTKKLLSKILLGYCIGLITVIGIALVWGNPYSNNKPKEEKKKYPVEILLKDKSSNRNWYMDADSVKHDTAYKDGNTLILTNVEHILLK